jgi:predicted nucleic acid-binding protein
MAVVLLDTTVLIDVLRGRPQSAARLLALHRAGDRVCVCAVNVEETFRGLRPSEQDPARRLFAGLRTAPLGKREGIKAGEWRRALAAGGRTVAQADALIAAAAHSLGASVATANVKDYPSGQAPMEDLAVQHWHAGG